MGWLTEGWTLGRSGKLEDRPKREALPERDLAMEQRQLAGLVPGRADWMTEEAPGDPVEYNTQLAKELRKLKKDAGAKSIKQNYRGTGSQKFRRQLWVRFKNGAVIDLWLERSGIGLGGVVKRRADDSAAPEPLPKSIAYQGRTPAEVYREVAPLLKKWAS